VKLKEFKELIALRDMNGLCHKCFRSNVEVYLDSGKVLCKACLTEIQNAKSR